MTSSHHPQSTGLDKKTSAILSYALGWLTGIFSEPADTVVHSRAT